MAGARTRVDFFRKWLVVCVPQVENESTSEDGRGERHESHQHRNRRILERYSGQH